MVSGVSSAAEQQLNHNLTHFPINSSADTSTNDYLNNIVHSSSDRPLTAPATMTALAAHNPMYSELPLVNGPTANNSDSASDCEYRRYSLSISCPFADWKCCTLSANKKLERGISRAIDNANVVTRARNEMAMDFEGSPLIDLDSISPCAPYFTFTIPDLTVYSEEFRKFIEKDLIETSTLVALESSQRLNWWASAYICQKLWPLSTTGDGNCLLHAASLGMWGFHDRKLTLRTALHNLLSRGEYRDALWRRWRFQQTKLNKQAGFVYSDYEWAKEWDEIVVMASPEPRQSTGGESVQGATRRRSFVVDPRSLSLETATGASGKKNVTYESLEEIHILALAHVLRRTIIVVADTMLRDMNGEAMAPINFNGIYLPFEVPEEECHRSPLLLTYDTAHFSALVPMDASSDFPPSLIPLVDCENRLCPVQFCIDPGASFDWRNYDGSEDVWSLSETEHISLLREYLNVVYALNPSSPDDEIYEDYWTDEETDAKRQFADSEVVLSDEAEGSERGEGSASRTGTGTSNKKATKQLQNVAKQFGSIGKNVSKKIRKNFGSITSNFKHGGGGAGGQQASSGQGAKKGSGGSGSQKSGSISKFSKVLCAELKSKRHPYQQEMINNYLECAHVRFRDLHGVDGHLTKQAPVATTAEATSSSGALPLDFVQPQTVALTNTPTSLADSIAHCINTGCQNFGTSTTHYMCEECFERQRRQEAECKFNGTPRYGTGNSKFYTQTDSAAHKQIQNLAPVRRLHELDQTLYLSNSTFFNDKLATKGSAQQHVVEQQQQQPTTKVINHKILVEGLDYNHPIPFEQGPRPIPPPRKESQQRHAIYFGPSDVDTGVAQPCKTAGCPFFGNPSTNYFCSKCRQSFAQPAKILTDV